MKAVNLKISLLVFSILGFTILLQSCSEDNSTEQIANQTDNFNLISPNGKILANKTDDLKEMILRNSEIQVPKDEINFESINYVENEKATLAIISFIIDNENKSMLVPLEINDGYSLLIDNENLIIKKNDNFEKQNFNIEDAIFLEDDINKSENYASRTAYVCNGGCCGWADMGNDHYHCGCPSAKLILTTGGNCQIQVIPD